jgi:PAS domain S-box-containing protein
MAIYASGIDAILLTTPDGGIVDANQAACRMFGMSREELLRAGRRIADPSDVRLYQALEERQKKGAAMAKIRFIRKDGSNFWGQVAAHLFHTSSGKVYSTMVIRDLTAIKETELNQYGT